MPVSRRGLLKTLAIAPATLFIPLPSMAATGRGFDSTVNIFLLGLFMMEFQGDDLVLVTPKYHHHDFCIVKSDGTRAEMPEYINLWDQLVPGSQDKFDAKNLKFPASALQNNGYVLDPNNPSKHKHRCTMVLPKPSQITVLGEQDISEFTPKPGKIGDYIKQGATEHKLGFITQLQYQSRNGQPYSFAYLALHRPLTLGTVNEALRAARNPCGQGFDLQMSAIKTSNCGGMGANKCPDWSQLNSFFILLGTKKFNKSLCELNVDVASCPQFGITK
jgi:hypothetical protein